MGFHLLSIWLTSLSTEQTEALGSALQPSILHCLVLQPFAMQ